MLRPFCKYLLYGLVFSLCIQCKPKDKATNEEILAEAGGKVLLKGDIPPEYWNILADSDSSGLLKLYIERWVSDQLMLREAENNLSSKEKDKEKMIEDYRTSLLIYEYRQKLIKEKLDTSVTEQDIDSFYRQNLHNFQLKKNIVKIRYVKINKNNPAVNRLKQLIQNPGATNDSLLRMLSEKEAENFYTDNNWLYLDDIIKEIPLDENYNQARFLNNNKFITIEENGILYLLYIIDYRIKNTDSPLEFEKDKIRDILLYRRKQEFLQSIQRQLLENATKDGSVKIHSQNY